MLLANLDDYEQSARAVLSSDRFDYFAGGSGDEITLRANRDAFCGWHIAPRVLVDVASACSTTTVLGIPVAMPLLVAPMSFHRLAHPEGELATARAAAAAGTIMCLAMFASTSPRAVADAAPGSPRWFQVYPLRDAGAMRAAIAEAADAGFQALVLTVDTPRVARRERDVRSGFQVPADVPSAFLGTLVGSGRQVSTSQLAGLLSPSFRWSDVESLVSTSPLPLVLKGVLTADDAARAVACGVHGLIVSNHGGRQLDAVTPSIDALSAVVEAVDGRIEILLDGGVRRATDVVIALALGASAVLVGRPILWGLAVAGEQGVRDVLTLFRDDITTVLALMGAQCPGEINRAHVVSACRCPTHRRD